MGVLYRILGDGITRKIDAHDPLFQKSHTHLIMINTSEGHTGGLIREDFLRACASPHRQCAGTSTYERSSAATEGHPSSFRVRSTSARRISSARATPVSPAAARP